MPPAEPREPGARADADPHDALALPAPRPPRPLTAPPHRGRVLVLAPHPDDEVIGPGGTLLLHVAAGDPVFALFLTSGVHGDNRGRYTEADYIALRRREAAAAAAVLGLSGTEFWDYPDNMVVTRGDLAAVTARLRDLVVRLAPDVIYAPHPGELHGDHHFTALAAQAAVGELARAVAAGAAPAGLARPPALLGYEVWSPLEPDWVVDTAAVHQRKLDAVRCYKSQLERNDIPRAVDGLNRFRAVLLPPGGTCAEAFRDLS